jgi:DNA-binding NarL/FixJ family response regulator
MIPLRLLYSGHAALPDIDNIVLVGRTTDLTHLLRLCDEGQPQILLLQTSADLEAVTTLITACRQHLPHLKIIVYADFTTLDYTRALVSAGAMGHITELHDLESVLHTVQSGKLVFSPQITRLLFASA